MTSHFGRAFRKVAMATSVNRESKTLIRESFELFEYRDAPVYRLGVVKFEIFQLVQLADFLQAFFRYIQVSQVERTKAGKTA